jgi:hypothetical protein
LPPRGALLLSWKHFSSRRSGHVVRLVAVLVFLGATSAAAAPVDTLFQEFGLFGTWAPDCTQPATPANPHVSITLPSPGLVQEEHNLGPKYTLNHYSILSAERVSPDELSVEVIFQPGTEVEERQKLVFRVRNDTRRTMFNQPDDGPVRVKDGIVLARGAKTPVLNKCE